ncbi:GNAT family N-acetyltransferase [Wenxinia saemankumensis]|uniref:Acetyltransferase (GNAT) family protein n=1 Tax=Wenxinia saemankumensis TaxID=1447782 RepID=A0A1M6EUU4_9RHOB|nr:GNAT family N-acetyltransferase [Wenxinia saemankumensis]SHI89120.1 Acetyltransferase (GNAT) family protein [Wenxinia saemankumensis]
MIPPARLRAAAASTWPPRRILPLGPVTLRDGGGGGSRVGAATVDGTWTGADLDAAAAAMRDLGQPPLFMVRAGEGALDCALAARGYAVRDPVVVRAAPPGPVAARDLPPGSVIECDRPVAAQVEIWAAGGIGAARRAVMDRAPAPKTALLGRVGDLPAGAAHLALSDGIAVLHALEVAGGARRRGLARAMMTGAARWAQRHGAEALAILVTRANDPANALYDGLGMGIVDAYHYRVAGPAA